MATARLEMFIRFTDGSGYTGYVVRDTPQLRREMDRVAWHMLSKPNVVAVDVEMKTGRSAGYTNPYRRNS
jgi:hypothetical protein